MPRRARRCGWYACFAPGGPGYSGVAIYSRAKPDEVEIGLGERRFDVEGRLIAVRFSRTFVVNGYFPKGSGSKRDNSRVPYKLDFYRAVFKRVQHLRRRGAVFMIGDFNTAHEAIDLARPKENVKNSGFLPEERAELTRWIDAGWVDTFRARNPVRMVITPGGGSGAARASAMSAGGSTMYSPRRAQRSG